MATSIMDNGTLKSSFSDWNNPTLQLYITKNKRGFYTSLGNVEPSTIDKYEKWTVQQKAEWEQAHADDTDEVEE